MAEPLTDAPARDLQLREASAELDRRLRAGERLAAEAVLAAYPKLANDPESALQLIYEELVLRERLGEQPAYEEYYGRFPQWHNELRKSFDIHEALVRGGGKTVDLAPAPLSAPEAAGTACAAAERRYELLGELGRGGMGVVYRARQPGLKRLVALKMILAGQYASAEGRTRFRIEAEAIARLQHPNIVQIYEVGEQDGQPFLALEYVDGGSLAGQLDGKPLPLRAAAGLLETLARAVHYAHEHGVLHRDLKPANILFQTTEHTEDTETRQKKENKKAQEEPSALDPAPLSLASSVSSVCSVVSACPKITDFGLAKRLPSATGESASTGPTATGQLLGTPSYMAPEQARGELKALGPATDVYALGTILYECLTGHPPFQGETVMETLQLVCEQEPVSPRRLQPKVPRDLETICLKCLEQEPCRRYTSAAELAEDLRRFLAGEAIRARSVTQAERLWRWCRRNPAVASLLAVVAVLAVAFVGYQAWALHRLAAEQRQTQAALDNSQRLAAELALDKGQLLGEQGEVNRALLWMAHSLKLAPAGARDLELVVRKNLDAWRSQVYPLRRILPQEASVGAVAFAPEGKTFLTTTHWATVTVRRWQAPSGLPGEDLPRLDAPKQALVETLSPDRRTLLLGWRDGYARLLDVATGQRLWQRQLRGAITALAFSRDGKTALLGGTGAPNREDTRSGWAQLIEVATGALVGPPLQHGRPVTAVAFSPDGTTFVTESGLRDAREKGQQQLWDARGQPLGAPQEYVSGALAVTFSPDGQQLWTGHWNDTARLWDPATGKQLRSLRMGGPVSAFAFRPDGKALLVGSYANSAQVWDPATAQPLSPPLMHHRPVVTVAFSPDGKFILTGAEDSTVRLWEVAAVAAAGPAWAHGELSFPLTFSRDHKVLLIPEENETVRLRDAVTGQPIRGPLQHPGRLWKGAFSPDFTRVVTVGEDQTARLWNLATGEALTDLKPPQMPQVFAVAFSPDSTRIVTGCWGGRSGSAWLWDAATGQSPQLLHPEPSGPVFDVAFSPDGQTILTGGADGVVRRWDAATRTPVGEPLAHVGHVITVAFSRDGQTILTGGAGGAAQLWEAATGKRLGRPLEHPDQVFAVAFSPDGQTLLTGCRDGKARLWDAATGKLLGRPLPHPGPVYRVAFWYDGKSLLTAASDSTVPFAGAETSARFGRVPAPLDGDARQLELWVQVVTGMQLEADGAARLLGAPTWQERRQQLQDSGFGDP